MLITIDQPISSMFVINAEDMCSLFQRNAHSHVSICDFFLQKKILKIKYIILLLFLLCQIYSATFCLHICTLYQLCSDILIYPYSIRQILSITADPVQMRYSFVMIIGLRYYTLHSETQYLSTVKTIQCYLASSGAGASQSLLVYNYREQIY